MTEQIDFWKGAFGNDYVDRNATDFNKIYMGMYGVTKSELNNSFLAGIDKNSRILEVGCNVGNQLKLLKDQGFNDLWAIEINRKALAIAKQDTDMNIVEGNAFDIPFKDQFFDMVFISGVLIHIHPEDLPKAINEMYRTSKQYLWVFEYYSETVEEIPYRGHRNRMWKGDYLKLFMEQHPDLKIVKEIKINYIDSSNQDVMFLLEKPE